MKDDVVDTRDSCKVILSLQSVRYLQVDKDPCSLSSDKASDAKVRLDLDWIPLFQNASARVRTAKPDP